MESLKAMHLHRILKRTMQKIQLLLTKPCTQNWDDMQVSKGGRYCDTCAKHIVDLTAKTDAELIEFFKKKKDNVCGRLSPTQLNRELTLPRPKSNWHWLVPFALGASAITSAKAAVLKPIAVQSSNIAAPFAQQQVPIPCKPSVGDTINGTVVTDADGRPLVGVKIKKKGFENVLALTDSAGKFSLNLPKGETADTLVFESPGFIATTLKASDGMHVKMSEAIIMLGGISSVHVTNEPLYIITAGKKSCTANAATFKEINPEWLDDVEILKGAGAAAIYGIKGANGVVILKVKKKYAHKIDFSKKD